MSLYSTIQVAIAEVAASNEKELKHQLQKQAKLAAIQKKAMMKKHKREKQSIIKMHRKKITKLVKNHEAERKVRTCFNFISIFCILYY